MVQEPVGASVEPQRTTSLELHRAIADSKTAGVSLSYRCPHMFGGQRNRTAPVVPHGETVPAVGTSKTRFRVQVDMQTTCSLLRTDGA
jgi:hypothetical protein